MPIPQLRNNKNQNWRLQKKKYFVSPNRNTGYGHGKQKTKIFDFSGFLNSSFGKKVILSVAIFCGLAILAVSMFLFQISKALPDPNRLLDRQIAQSTKIYDRTGEKVLYEIHGAEQRTLIKLEEIPPYLKWATIAIEDKNFYNHSGISFWAIFRTFITNVLYGQKAGGSTLTQQFIKNSMLTSEKRYIRKIKEVLLAYKLEKSFSKDEILQMYFNEIPYGSTAYGVEAASQRYFGKSVRDINLAESCILAALPQGPTRYSPYGSNLELLLGRQKYILDLMVEQGRITAEEAQTAKDYQLEFKPPTADIKAPHFVMYVKEMLSDKYGEKTIEQGGLKIITTLDLYKQEIAEQVVTELAEKNEKNYNATNAALVSIDPKTGQILAMVGSRDYFNQDIDGQVNISTSKRQPGSSLKPLVYAACFLKGYTPNTILYDVVTNFSTEAGKSYEPHNYDSKEHGPISMRKALAGSLNIPAVKAIYLAGIKNVSALAHDFGYTTLDDEDRFGLSLVLGGAEVKLLEHVNAYGAFAREGMLNPVASILRIESADGTVLEEFLTKEKRVIDPKVAQEINSVLSDNSARAYVFGEKNWLTLGSRPVAAKTGTTNDYHDAWTVGYTPSLVTGVWVGNSNNDAMKRGADGSQVAAPIWHDYMERILGDTPIEEFRRTGALKTGKPVLDGETSEQTIYKIDKISGLLATEFTPPELIVEKSFSQDHSILYYIDKDDPLGTRPENPEKDPQFHLWENAVLAWAKKKSASSTPETEIDAISQPPTEKDNIHLPENLPVISIVTPTNNQTVLEPTLFSRIEASAPRGIKHVDYYINGNLLQVATEYPFGLARQISFLNNGFHNLRATACDDVENCTSQDVEFNLILENNSNKNKIVSLNMASPENGLALNNIDFPLLIELNTNEPDLVSKINIYSSINKQPVLIQTISPISSSLIQYQWTDIPPSGAYSLFAEAVTWAGETIKTKQIVISINNALQQ